MTPAITLKPYDPTWKKTYEMEKSHILEKISPWIIDIQHVGSTAIEGIAAKAIIDILIGVDSLKDADQHIISPLTKMGYHYIKAYEEDAPYRRYFEKLDDYDNHLIHIHLVPIGCDFWQRLIHFRDYLINHPNKAKEYEALKIKLANSCTERHQYTLGKSEFVHAIEKSS